MARTKKILKTKKNLKMRRKNFKKITRKNIRRGGQLTPLSDISTNSSIHDLDDYDEPSNNTTVESTMSEYIAPVASGPAQVATNLLGQFNAASDEDNQINDSNNTSMPSEASSENSFSNVATSFGNLGHGGKRQRERESKGGKKTRKQKKHLMR